MARTAPLSSSARRNTKALFAFEEDRLTLAGSDLERDSGVLTRRPVHPSTELQATAS